MPWVRLGAQARWWAVLACVAWPWLNPLAPGPSTSVLPWLVSAACAALLGLVCPSRVLSRPVATLLAGTGAVVLGAGFWGATATGGWAAPLDLAGALGALTVVALAAMVAARVAASPDAGQPGPWWTDLRLALAWGWLLAAGLSSAIALLQYSGHAAGFAPWVSPASAGLAYGNLRQPNQYATLSNLGLAVLVWRAGAAPAPGRLALAAGGGLAVLMALGNAASSSRTGLLQLLLVGLWALLWLRPAEPAARWRVRVLCGLALLAYGLAVLGLPWWSGPEVSRALLTRLGDTAVVNCSSRVTLWANALTLLGEHPWRGWGWGELDYGHYLTLFPSARFCDILDNAHNLPLHLAVEAGLPAGLLLCGGVLWGVWRARPWRERAVLRQLAWLVLALLALHSLLEYPLWYGPFQMALGLALGLLWPVRAPGHASNRLSALADTRWFAMILLACVVYAAWDYRRISQVYLAPEARAPVYRERPLEAAQASWLFANQVAFARLTTLTLTADNAAEAHALAGRLLHYSPEPRVIEKRIESALLLGLDEDAAFHTARYRAAFPAEHARWSGEPAAASAP